MTRRHNSRLARVRHAIDAAPVQRGILEEAYGWFTDFGELPDDDHVAYEVVQRALRGGESDPISDVVDRVRRARLAYYQHERPAAAWPPSVRAMLFDEALFEAAPMRDVARRAIAAEVAWGGDVENPAFASRHGIPGYGSVAMHVVGWPKKLAMPPYEDQANRLFVRMDNLRGRIPQQDTRWVAEQAEAMVRFRSTGELPVDDLRLEALLVDVELDQLIAHGVGKDVAEAMAVLDAVAWADEEDAEAALVRLREIAVAKVIS